MIAKIPIPAPLVVMQFSGLSFLQDNVHEYRNKRRGSE